MLCALEMAVYCPDSRFHRKPVSQSVLHRMPRKIQSVCIMMAAMQAAWTWRQRWIRRIQRALRPQQVSTLL